MTSPELPALFTGLFDDAALFPPSVLPSPTAVQADAWHRRVWYSPLVRPFGGTFCSFGTCSIDEPVTDLLTLGLTAAGQEAAADSPADTVTADLAAAQ